MTIYDEPKIDCHNHIFDPARFPYPEGAFYRPTGAELGTAEQFRHVLDAYGVRHALLVGRPDIDRSLRASHPRGRARPARFQGAPRAGAHEACRPQVVGAAEIFTGPSPLVDTRPYVRALIDPFTLDACVWGSDWPFLRAPARVDYGPLLKLAEDLLPDAGDRRRVCWDTPRRLFGFDG